MNYENVKKKMDYNLKQLKPFGDQLHIPSPTAVPDPSAWLLTPSPEIDSMSETIVWEKLRKTAHILKDLTPFFKLVMFAIPTQTA